ncbi:reverse transcriptase-like protein [Salipaludibacillus daqingensis]|uniref:reverse transcriptase-like protein n=1 Tax=Salipaludibacillus daqingensis TaxID=3041001 RepID=UPI002476EF8F|nr:reverse transcriptase-like protein [Salipaludibacillus daqingensis]
MKGRLEITYKTKKGTETMFSSEDMSVEKAILIAQDLEKTGRLKNILFVDNNESSWSVKDIKKYIKEIDTEPHNVVVYFDGGFDIETRVSGLGCVIYYEKNGKTFRIRKNAQVKELDTNNEAEYAALHLALKELEILGVHHLPVDFVGDSQVVINQLIGEWPCVEEVLNEWANRVESRLATLGVTPSYHLISRKKNREADQLASQALKNIEITSDAELKQE